jgi:hypothetical protein
MYFWRHHWQWASLALISQFASFCLTHLIVSLLEDVTCAECAQIASFCLTHPVVSSFACTWILLYLLEPAPSAFFSMLQIDATVALRDDRCCPDREVKLDRCCDDIACNTRVVLSTGDSPRRLLVCLRFDAQYCSKLCSSRPYVFSLVPLSGCGQTSITYPYDSASIGAYYLRNLCLGVM